jgi:hypothetical protein
MCAGVEFIHPSSQCTSHLVEAKLRKQRHGLVTQTDSHCVRSRRTFRTAHTPVSCSEDSNQEQLLGFLVKFCYLPFITRAGQSSLQLGQLSLIKKALFAKYLFFWRENMKSYRREADERRTSTRNKYIYIYIYIYIYGRFVIEKKRHRNLRLSTFAVFLCFFICRASASLHT